MKILSGLISAVVCQFHGTFERGGGMVSSTCVDDFVLMGEIEGAHKLKGELSHEECSDSIVREPDTKGRQGLAQELEDETHVGAVGPCELKVVDQVADVFVAQELAVSIAEPTEDLSLEDGMFMAVAFVTQDFEGPEAMLVVWPGNFRRGRRRRRALDVLFREVLDQPNRRISSPSKLAHDLVLVCIDVADVDGVKATGLVSISTFLNVVRAGGRLFRGISAVLNAVHPDSNSRSGDTPGINHQRIRDSRTSAPLFRHDNT